MKKWLFLLGAVLALVACSASTPHELAGRWNVQQIAGASLGEDVDIWIEFDGTGEAVHGFTGCNDFTTSASVFGTNVAFGELEEAAGACATPAAEVDEARFLHVLPAVQRYVRHGHSLELLQAAQGSEALIRLRRDEPN
ncbi:MAG: META domain-containing protein [Hyphomonadaceae bacterium]